MQQKYGDQFNLQYCISILDYYETPIAADIVISEIELDNAIFVSPFITADQLKEIGRCIDKKLHSKESDNFNLSFRQMFTENIFFQNIYGKDKYEILETIGKELKAKDYVDDTDVYKRQLQNTSGSVKADLHNSTSSSCEYLLLPHTS